MSNFWNSDSFKFLQKIMLSFHEEQEVLPETFLANFPSLIKMDIHKKVTDPSVAKSMMACLLSSLKANGSRGAFCEVRPDDKRILEFYSKLGCFEIAKMEGFPKDVVILGRSLWHLLALWTVRKSLNFTWWVVVGVFIQFSLWNGNKSANWDWKRRLLNSPVTLWDYSLVGR